MKALPLIATIICSFTGITFAAGTAPPAGAFDLREWKLQIPGPLEIKQLAGYSSPYFFLNKSREMVFHLDAAEPGTTPNTKYVRSELRHLPNWHISEPHNLSAEVKVLSHLDPEKVTVLQIHGIQEDGSDAPPLLRIALNHGDLVAMIKPDNEGERTDSIPLKKGVGANWFKVEIAVKNRSLVISVDGAQKVTHSLAYWKYPNYFKAGCYPQATQGTADIFFRKLSVK
ncbi:MAG: polysaccharide lyase family 7 protein [Chthoniobacteraceae bacterium]